MRMTHLAMDGHMPQLTEPVNGCAHSIPSHLGGDGERPIMGSSEGAANRQAQAKAEAIIAGLLLAADPKDAFEHAAFQIGTLIGLGQVDRTLMADLLWRAASKIGL